MHYNDNDLKVNLSDYLAAKLHREYSALSKLFSEVTDTTIEKYLIAQKIERAKELAGIRRTIPERNSRQAELFERSLPQLPIQERHRVDTQLFQEDKSKQAQTAWRGIGVIL